MFDSLKQVYSYRTMLESLVKKDLRSRYRGSFFGFLWTFINPLMQLIIYSVVFPYLLKMSEENYPLFVFIGLLPWIFFTSSLQISTTIIVANGNLVKKIYFPRMILPLSVCTTALVNYVFGLVIVFLALLFFKVGFGISIILLPLILLIQYIFVSGLSLILSALYVYFRDLEHIIAIILMAWFYLTPVVFSIDIFPQHIQRILKLNPMTQFIMMYRDIMLYKTFPKAIDVIILTLFSVIIFAFGCKIFTSLDKRFAEEI